LFTIPSATETSQCGLYSFSAYYLLKGGLQANYYTNKWFSGTPFLSKIDT